jgi:hypothetical protein
MPTSFVASEMNAIHKRMRSGPTISTTEDDNDSSSNHCCFEDAACGLLEQGLILVGFHEPPDDPEIGCLHRY